MRTSTQRRISICQFSTFRWTFEEDVIRYATHGFKNIGIWRRKLDEDCLAAIDLLYEAKMSVSSVHWAGGFTGDGQSFSNAIEDGVEAIELASRVDAGCLIIHPGSRNGHTTSHARRLFSSALENLLPIAADYGVTLALEPVLDQLANPWSFMNQFEESIEFLQQFPSQHLGLVLDLFSFGFDSNVFELLASYVNRISLVQIADRCQANPLARLPLGAGQVPLKRWLGSLQQLGYSGSFELEVHGPSVKEIDYFSLLDQTHNFFSERSMDRLIALPSKSSRISQQTN